MHYCETGMFFFFNNEYFFKQMFYNYFIMVITIHCMSNLNCSSLYIQFFSV